jgi:hypothetical protein
MILDQQAKSFVKPKKFVRLTEDHMYEHSFIYPEENCFILAGTEGIIIDEHTLDLIPNLSE